MKSFIELARERYSVRKFDQKPVEDEKLALILEAAKVAPTACNYQPQKIYVIKDAETRAKLAKICPCTFNAPVIFAVGYDDSRSAKGMIQPDFDFGNIDSSIVCSHMMLEAQDLGLGTCWVGYFREKEVAQLLGTPENIHIRALLPTGYAAQDATPAKLHSQYRDDSETVVILG